LQTINTNSQEKIYLNVYNDGILTQATATPRVTIYDADSSTYAANGVQSNTPLSGFNNLIAHDEDADGSYSFLLTPAITSINRVLEVRWSYSINGIAVVQTDFYQIETPYATVAEVNDFLNFDPIPSDLNYIDPVLISNAEKVARTIIEGYTGVKFYKYYGGQEIYGIGANTIQLTERMISLDKIFENEVLVYDRTSNPVYNTFGYNTAISPSGYQIRVWQPDFGNTWNNELDPIHYMTGRFRDNSLYRFVGQIGYKYVPEDIKTACMLLIQDIISNDYNWRNKYLSKVNLKEISFEMAKGAFNGTGNITVDNILDQYRKTNIVII
jgi:hypothetical protein